MPEIVEPTSLQPSETAEGQPGGGGSITVAILLGLLACALWALSTFLPNAPAFARADSLYNWTIFAGRILRDSMQAAGLVIVSLAVALFSPRLGLFIERLCFRSRRATFLAVVAGWCVLSSGLFNYFVLDHMPHIQDEIAMEFQAKILATGRIAAPAPHPAEFFDCEFVLNDGAKWYGKYFVGQSLFLVPGLWVGMPWLVHPVLAGLAVLLTYWIGIELLNDRIARIAALLMAVSPFRVSLFAMMLGHPSSLILLTIFALAAIKVVKDPSRWGWALIGILSLGMAGNARPLTAVALGGVIGLLAVAFMPWRRITWKTLATTALGCALSAGLFLGYNKALTGKALLTPFNQWSKTDRLGFGPDVGLEYWRESDKGHTLQKAVTKDLYFNFDALGANLTGWGRGTLLMLAVPLLGAACWRRAWLLALCVGSLAVAHLFHVSHGVLAGQARYWSESMPMMMLLAALGVVTLGRFTKGLCNRAGIFPAGKTVRAGYWLGCTLLCLWSIPNSYQPLLSECMSQFWGQGPTVRDLAAHDGLKNALVFVRAGGHYRTHFRSSGSGMDLFPCGFMLDDPDLKGSIVYARDLGDEKNAALIAQYPGRKLYRVDPKMAMMMRFVPYEETLRGNWPDTRPAAER
jgi:hypothetical protein